jgi:hypothetical protein
MRKIMFAMAVSLGLAACTTMADTRPLDGSELYGHTIRVDGGSVTTRTTFNRDGTATTRLPNGQSVSARYYVQNGRLCFAPMDNTAHECWAYTERLVRGRTVDARAPDGTAVRVTLE